jgi:hypothetical protein
MNIVKCLAIAAVAATTLASTITIASAQAGRDAAVGRCIQRAQAQFPGTDATVDRNRTSVYKACMTEAGFTP